MVKCDITELVSLVSEVSKILPGALLSLLGRGKALQDITKLPWILGHKDGRNKQKPEEARPEDVFAASIYKLHSNTSGQVLRLALLYS